VTTAIPESPEFLAFWRERRICTLTTLRPDGSPHVVPMGVVLDRDAGVAWAITSTSSRKARNIRAAEPIALVAVCQVDGASWSTIEGTAAVVDNANVVREAERRYAERYKVPRPNPHRVAIRIDVDRVLGNVR
jgi:PPOX class probable F420-dependent enzyme